MELRALLGCHRVEHLLHRRHRARHLLEQLVERLRVTREEVSVALHEALEVGLLAAVTLLEHLVQLGEHVLHARHLLGRDVLHALGHLVEVALQQLLAQLVHELLERATGVVVHEVVLLHGLHASRKVGRHELELQTALRREVLHDLAAPLIARVARLLQPALDALALLVEDLIELLGDVVVDAAEVPVLELLAPALTEPLEHLPHPHQVLAVAVLEALLEHPAHRGVEVAVVEEIVRHLRQERVGVEIETALGAVPSGVLERGPRHAPRVPGTHRR